MVEIHGKQDQDSAQNGGTLEKEDRQTPLLDLPEAAVKELVRTAKNAVMLNTIRLTRCWLPKKSVPSRLRTSWRSSARWASTWSRQRGAA
jgi:hypothetical protein